MSYVYIQSETAGQKIYTDENGAAVRYEHNLYTVGFYAPDGKWEPESDHATREEAAERVAYLNGGKQ
jgi:hypothetical protein